MKKKIAILSLIAIFAAANVMTAQNSASKTEKQKVEAKSEKKECCKEKKADKKECAKEQAEKKECCKEKKAEKKECCKKGEEKACCKDKKAAPEKKKKAPAKK